VADDLPASREALERKIRELREQMLEHARNLEFEEAATLRDRLNKLQEQMLVL
jgi:excinuclease ABC subunit B